MSNSNLTLVADGFIAKDERAVLWSHGNYSYEFEINGKSEFQTCSYEYAIDVFKSLCSATNACCVY